MSQAKKRTPTMSLGKAVFLGLGLALVGSAAVRVGAGGGRGQVGKTPVLGQGAATAEPTFTEVAVHDPSLVVADGQFYIFGSHLAAARSKDLMQWERFADRADDQNPLFVKVRDELKATFEWAQTRTLWAPDVIPLPDGRFAMYYNACKGDSPRSALGLALASKVEGPYRDQGILLKSGMWGQPSEDGTVYEAREHPNTVDPDAFYDSDGKLWMVYGSYSGGIFILKLDPATGKPLPGQGYGTKLLGGNHSRIEGPCILYSPTTKYYYLFLSFGGLDLRGGYNIRVARSLRPDGPYTDAEGKPMRDAKSDPSRPLFDDRSIEGFGTKLVGNFQLTLRTASGTGHKIGYVSPGHNTVYRDSKTDQLFLIFHTRFPERGEAHEVRVHPMFLNADGWPVVAPYRYASESAGKVERDELVGDYQTLRPEKAISADTVTAKPLRLEKDGTLTGTLQGRWTLTGDSQLTLEAEGTRYSGTVLRQWDAERRKRVLTFTVLSVKRGALWGVVDG